MTLLPPCGYFAKQLYSEAVLIKTMEIFKLQQAVAQETRAN